jgi:SAM-dependent methyltransferase
MATGAELCVEDRIMEILGHLGIQHAHFGAGVMADWVGLVTRYPDLVSSLAVVSPQGFDSRALKPLEDRLLVITGDSGPVARLVDSGLSSLNQARHSALQDCFNAIWTDLTGDRTEEVQGALTSFLEAIDSRANSQRVEIPEGEGEVAGINYRVRGSGPPLILLPLGLSPSQWEPLIPQLAAQYCTVTLGGAYIGAIRNHEERARHGYSGMVRLLVDRLNIQDGYSILDVGCGSGAHDRYLATLTAGKNSITSVDHSPYMIREASDIAKSQGLSGMIDFREGNAENLPFPDDSFDVVMSVTVMEEVRADRMFSELVRVAKPGGTIGVIVRAVDLPWVVNVPVSESIKRKVEAPGVMGGGANPEGCGDIGLYSRFSREGLRSLEMFPYLMTVTGGSQLGYWQTQALAVLTQAEQEEWRAAAIQSQADGTFFMANHFHCAVGTKPK